LKRREFTAYILLDGLRTAGEGDGQLCPAFEAAATAGDKVGAFFAGAGAATSPQTVPWLLDKDPTYAGALAAAQGAPENASDFASRTGHCLADSVDVGEGSF
jgi:hypothetical protein